MNTFFNSNIYMDIGIIIIYLGLGGILLNRNNIIISIICIEIVFYGINYYLLTSALIIQDLEGLVVSFFVLTVAAAESAVALGILMVYFKIFKNILL
uniref:NADH-ubiquinone oxidoreductase chain 4L n=1 Tax=Cafileria marina TaxID=2557541 RepID=A0A5B9IN98_9STRA|nr:NADH dehydrogenase subunit 4L [Cafileria marina]QEF30254.1 NADH dehydrogenase subunit 4L [Cafileria marina]